MIRLCRNLLKDVTPLRTDCGKICGAGCCESLDGEETGMLLFPGEEAFYAGCDWCKMIETQSGTLLVCNGACDRDNRPLACRIYPLLPKVTDDGGIKVVKDARAKGRCPLTKECLAGFDPDFLSAVKQVGEILLKDESQREFLNRLTEQQNDLIALRKLFGGT